MFYISTKFCENISEGVPVTNSNNRINTRVVKIYKGGIKLWMVFGYLFSAYCLIMLYICTKFQENTLKGFRVIDRM